MGMEVKALGQRSYSDQSDPPALMITCNFFLVKPTCITSIQFIHVSIKFDLGRLSNLIVMDLSWLAANHGQEDVTKFLVSAM